MPPRRAKDNDEGEVVEGPSENAKGGAGMGDSRKPKELETVEEAEEA